MDMNALGGAVFVFLMVSASGMIGASVALVMTRVGNTTSAVKGVGRGVGGRFVSRKGGE